MKNFEEFMKEQYHDSTDYEADVNKCSAALDSALTIVTSADLKKYCKMTDDNYDTRTVAKRTALEKAIQAAVAKFNEFDAEMRNAE